MKQSVSGNPLGLVERMAIRSATLDLGDKDKRQTVAAVIVELMRVTALLHAAQRQSRQFLQQIEQLERAVDAVGCSSSLNTYSAQMKKDVRQLVATVGVDPARPRRASTDISYVVARTAHGDELFEYRKDGREGFRVRREDYFSAVEVIAEAAGQPLKFDELTQRFAERIGKAKPAEYPMRMLLRFWRSTEPPLLRKERTRYTPIAESIEEFRHRAIAVWEQFYPNA